MERFDREKKEPSIIDVYFLLGSMSAKVDALTNMNTKVILALISLVGATLGLQLVKSPPVVVVSRFLNMFVFLFASLVGISLRKKLDGWYFILAYGIAGVTGNLISLIGGEGPTSGFRVPVFIVANFALLMFLWRWDKWDKRGGA